MFSKRSNKLGWLLVVVLLLALSVSPVWAMRLDDGPSAKVKITREPERDSGTQAVTQPARSTQPAPAAQPAAAAVKIEAPAAEVIQPVEAPEVEHPVEVEFKGSIESINGDTLVVAGQTVVKNAQTSVQGTLAVGAFVEVEGFLQSDHSVLAKSIKVEHNDGEDVGEVEFKAPIVSFPAGAPYHGTWVVGDYTVVADAQTQIDVSRALPAVGVIAEVKATQQSDGTLHADRIQTEDEGDFENEAEFKGTISYLTCAPGAYDMMVGDRHVTTDGATAIVGTLSNGAFVEVHGAVQLDGSVLADRIQVEDPVGLPDEKEFRSTITTLPAGFIGTWTFANGESVTVDASTVIDESRGPAQAGALAEVKAVKQGAQWVAVRIQIEND
jgi:hypothetical protein